MKLKLLLFAFLLPLCLGFSKTKYTYYVKQQAPLDTAFVYPNYQYIYQILIKEQVNGSLPANFTATLRNGKFVDNGDTILKNIPGFYDVKVKWDDIPLEYSKISITGTSTDTANVVLQKGRTVITKLIASLKGQTPTLTIGTVPTIGSATQFTAQVNDMVYPGIYIKNIYGIYVNKTVNKFEWTLPNNWKTIDNKTGTFITDVDVKQITVIPDYVTVGTIKVRGINDVGSAYSETASQYFDRGFSYINYPTSITFGDNSTKTFSTALFNGITYEWSVPAGWKINGQGNVLQGLNLNSVSITPSFCSFTDGKVQVRLKKDANVSDWYICPYQGVSQPVIIKQPSIYQYEDANFTISNIYTTGVNTITWTGDGVATAYNQGLDSKLVFTKSGLIRVNASILMNGCSTPIILSQDVPVALSRLSISGPSEMCNQEQFAINYLSSIASVLWSANGLTPYTGIGTSFTGSPVFGAGEGYVRATITISGNVFSLQKDLSLNGYVPIDGPDEAYLSQKKAYFTIDASTVTKWYVNGVAITPNPLMPNRVVVVFNKYPGGILVSCRVTTACGTFQAYKNLNVIDDMSYFSLYPNPASDEVQVSMMVDSTADIQTAMINNTTTSASLSVKVIDSYGSIVYNSKKSEKDFTIPISKFRNGIYTVSISDGTKMSQKKLVVKH